MRKIVQIVLWVSVVASVCHGQEYVAGKVKLTNGEERSGWVKVTTLKAMTQGCSFKPAPAADSTYYKTSDLQSYEVNGQRLLRQTIANTNRMMVVLNEGTYNLYQDHLGFYIKHKDDAQVEALIKTEKRLIRGDFVNVAIFKYQLDSLFRACDKMQGQAMNTDYNTTSLSNAVARYNNCMGGTSASTFVSQQPKATRKFGIKILGGMAP